MRLRDLREPIEQSVIGKLFQGVRAAIAGTLVGIAAVGLSWGVTDAAYLVVPGVVAALHAATGMKNPPKSVLASLLIDVTLLGTTLLLVANLPLAQVAAIAYILTASLLLLRPVDAALVVAYAALWASWLLTIAPLTSNDAAQARRAAALDHIGVVAFLAILALLLLAASRGQTLQRLRQRRALEAERRAGELKNEFVSMVSHELRTPLTSIAGFVETLADGWQSLESDTVDEFLGIIQTQTLILSNLVEDILVIPRLEAGSLPIDMGEFELQPVTERLVNHLVSPSAKEVSIAIPSGLQVNADQKRVGQILRNLLENAIKYGGDEILVVANEEPTRIVVTVSDNGRGVPESDVERIFEPFEQLSKGDARTGHGIGLGLPIARNLARAMGGDLWYEPVFPVGARFRFSLPVTPPEPILDSFPSLEVTAG